MSSALFPFRRLRLERVGRWVGLLGAAWNAHGVAAQQPNSAAPAYRPPIIMLAAPVTGASIPADKPVIVLRFAAGEPADGIDPSSLRLSVDGEDRTALLQLGSGEAWGPLARDTTAARLSSGASAGAPLIAPGVHLVHVRLCSMRGVCSTLDVPVIVAPPDITPSLTRALSPADSSAQQQTRPSLLRQVLGFVIAGARKLLAP